MKQEDPIYMMEITRYDMPNGEPIEWHRPTSQNKVTQFPRMFRPDRMFTFTRIVARQTQPTHDDRHFTEIFGYQTEIRIKLLRLPTFRIQLECHGAQRSLRFVID